MKTKLILLAVVVTVCAVACKRKTHRGVVPFLEFNSLTPNTVQDKSVKDTVFISFDITDGDGDLGVGLSDRDIYLIDSRSSQPWQLNLPDIPSDSYNPEIGISATCVIKLDAVKFLNMRPDHPNGDTLKYKICVKDKAGHVSDTIQTPPIYITP
ncbi:MAG: hypothetical protein JST82_03315 [Bacteroidetes bacterium]|nr:hypothetical protein [Bacteroidota bacterium]